MKQSDLTAKARELATLWLSGDGDELNFDAPCDAPETAWVAILEILRNDLDEEQLALLAAGPMENVLVWHGASFLDRVETEARNDARFNYLLGGVWRNEMTEEVWVRVQKARNKVW
jgi:hypothetical protein